MKHPLKSLIRIALIATYPLLAVSVLAFGGLTFTVAFVAEFTVENKTDKPIAITPVGTIGKQGDRHPLPVCMWSFLPIWSAQRGGFDIPPGESIDIIYDMDDINFSEIVVHDQDGERGQLVVNSNPTNNQYHAPAQKRFVIDDLDSLAAIPEPVRKASRDAQVRTSVPWIFLGVLFGPWIAFILLSWLNRSFGKTNAMQTHVATATRNAE